MCNHFTGFGIVCQEICWHNIYSDGKLHGANMGPIWGRQNPGGPNVGPMNFAIWDNNDLFLLTTYPSNFPKIRQYIWNK